jgi:hypothetical protein
VGTLKAYTTERDLEEVADSIKVTILRALVNESLLEHDEAERWARTHTVITKHKTFFRTISNFWNRAIDDGGFFYLVVKLVE